MVPFHQDLSAFCGAENIQLTNGPISLSRCALQQAHQSLGNRLHTAVLKEIAAILDRAEGPPWGAVGGAPFGQLKGQIEPGSLDVDWFKPGQDSSQLQSRFWGIVEGQHQLEERMTRQRASRIKQLNEPFEGQLLMSVGGQIGGAHTCQELAKAGIG